MKKTVGILFGGKSVEHEVSIESAKNVWLALDKKKYNSVLIYIDKNNKWFLVDEIRKKRNSDAQVVVLPGSGGELLNLKNNKKIKVDVVFPVLHGSFGEDGTIQGLLRLAEVLFFGADVIGSVIGIDKEIAKRLMQEKNISVAKFLSFNRSEKIEFNKVKKNLGLPFFIKPAHLGSSVGVHKIKNLLDFNLAIKDVWLYDNKILCEEFIDGREIECSVLGNEKVIASVPGEIKATHDFYSYSAKYIDKNGANLEIPAKLSAMQTKKIQEIAKQVYKILSCEGMARVDFFVNKKGKIIVNEINTIPGFTQISMYPKMWEASGIKYSKLIDELIKLAEQRFVRDKKLETNYLKK